METEQAKQVDWNKWEEATAPKGNFFKPEMEKEYVIKFKSAMESTMPEKKEGKLTGNTIPCIKLELSRLDGVYQENPIVWDVTSKTLLRQVAVYAKDGVLFDYEFKIKKTQIGGKQYPEYIMTPVLAPKVKKTGVEELMGV